MTCLASPASKPGHLIPDPLYRGFLTELVMEKVMLTVVGKMDSGRARGGEPEAGSRAGRPLQEVEQEIRYT